MKKPHIALTLMEIPRLAMEFGSLMLSARGLDIYQKVMVMQLCSFQVFWETID